VACFAELGPRPTEAATQLKRWAEERGITTVATHDCGIADGGERELFVLLRDGYTITADAEDAACGCNVASTGYEPSWYDTIAEDTGNHLLVPPSDSATAKKGMAVGSDASPKFKPKSKLLLKALQ
jgi:hypothetical protein